MESNGPSGRVTSSRPEAQHGDVDINGDLVDELRPSRRLLERERRLATCITAASPDLARAQLANVMRALDRVPA